MTLVAGVQTHILDHKLKTAFESASMSFNRRQHLLVEIECECGTVGWGECLGPAQINAAIVDQMKNRLIGKNPLDTEMVWLDLYHTYRDQGQRGATVTAISGIDVALWDIKGKLLSQPISVLLGGRFRESVPAYATGAFRREGVDRISAVVAEVLRYKNEGFHGIKLKIGFNAGEDLELIKQVRDSVGPDMRIMIDANHGYDATEAIAVGRAANSYNIDWFEEPVLPELLNSYNEVRSKQPIPVAGGETWHARWAMKAAIEAHAVDIIQPDVCGVGGFSEFKRVVDYAQMNGVRVVPHVWGTGVQIAASLQAIAAIPFAPCRREPLEPIFEFDRTENPFRQAILKKHLEHQRGTMKIPDLPGLGIEICRESLERFQYRP
jgi:D-galactarolactone cycloisomerase